MQNQRQNGFTLVELMIVVAIVGILAALFAAQFKNFVYKSMRAEAYLMLRGVHTAQTSYFAVYDRYLGDTNTSVLQVNLGLGIWNSIFTRYGYQFYYDFLPVSPALPIDYFALLSTDFDNDGLYDALFIQSQDFNFNGVGAYAHSVPVLWLDDILNLTN